VKGATVDLCKACDAGTLPSCVRFAEKRRWFNPREAAAAYTKACDGGELRGCVGLGHMYVGNGIERNYPLAAKLASKACDGNEPTGCTLLARLRLRSEPGVEVQTDKERVAAREMLERACKAHDARACGQVAGLFFDGRYGFQDRPRGAKLFVQSCTDGDLDSCRMGYNVWTDTPLDKLGVKHSEAEAQRHELSRRGDELRKAECADTGMYCNVIAALKPTEARARLGELCQDEHHLPACNDLAMMLDTGAADSAGRSRAVGLYEIACKGGIGPSCGGLGLRYERGIGVAKDPRVAVELYERSCALGYASGCDLAGIAYINGEGVARDVARSLELRRRACDWHNPEACHKLGGWLVLHDGEEIPEGKGMREGAARLQRACEEDSNRCHDYVLLYEHGWGVPKDPGKARSKAKALCQSGSTDLCRWLTEPWLKPDWVQLREEKEAAMKRKGKP
jgi:TPR repeat protein